MKILKKIVAVLCAFLLLNTSACKKQNDYFSFSGFNTQITVSVSEKALGQKIKDDMRSLVRSLENEFDKDIENSFTKRFNLSEKNQPVIASDVALKILSVSKTAHTLSGGSFDPTVYPLVSLWGFAPYVYKPNFIPPSEEEILSAKNLVGFDLVQINFEHNSVIKTLDNVKMDFGGIVKGYAVEALSKILVDNGYTKGYISVGSSSLKILSVEKLSVRHPRKNAEVIYEINLKGQSGLSVSTSGDYEKFHLTTSGEKFCHIIDPRTGYPTNTGIASATIVGVEGALGDALTTALCLKEYSPNDNDCELMKFISKILENYPQSSIYVVYQKGEQKIIITNKKQGEDFTLLDSEYNVVNV